MNAASLAAASAGTLLFVPGDRPERFGKAAAAGADLVVLDLEDAVAPENKEAARANVAAWAAEHVCAVRVNAADTPWYADDLAALAGTGCAVMVPKAENARTLAAIGSPHAVIALVETAAGVLAAGEIAACNGVVRLALGTFDLAAQLGVDPVDSEALAAAVDAAGVAKVDGAMVDKPVVERAQRILSRAGE